MSSLATRLREGNPVRCPYCHDHLAETEDAIECGGCHTSHHAECVRELGRCATYGCAEALVPGRAPENPLVREEIRARIREAAGRYADSTSAMAGRPRAPVGREARHDQLGFRFADRLATSPEMILLGCPLALIMLAVLAFSLLQLIYS